MDRVLCIALCLLAIVIAVCILVRACEPRVEVTVEPTTLPTVAETTEETTEVVIEHTETEVPTAATTEPPVVLYNVPLDEELQLHIIGEAEKAGIDPAIVFAIAKKESTYNATAVGDGGDSIGLLQVQPYWHSGRMERLGCTDLLDPYQNVTVAVDYLSEQLSRYGSMGAALTAYNQGHYNGTVTQYAQTVLAYAEQINNERGQ